MAEPQFSKILSESKVRELLKKNNNYRACYDVENDSDLPLPRNLVEVLEEEGARKFYRGFGTASKGQFAMCSYLLKTDLTTDYGEALVLVNVMVGNTYKMAKRFYSSADSFTVRETSISPINKYSLEKHVIKTG
jgi:hypothetical protein